MSSRHHYQAKCITSVDPSEKKASTPSRTLLPRKHLPRLLIKGG